jgi:acetyltransferase-like isoleucine patch superfamily enzyme
LLSQYNALPYNDNIAKSGLLKEMFGSIGTNVSVGVPFICDYGQNIHIGNSVSVNMNCTFIDCNKITIGNNVLIASNVQIYNYFPLLPFSKMLSRECRRECLWALFFIVFESYSIISSNANTKKTTVFFVKAP